MPLLWSAASIKPAVEPETPPLKSAFLDPFTSVAAVGLLLVLAPVWFVTGTVSRSLIGGIGEAVPGKGGVFRGIVRRRDLAFQLRRVRPEDRRAPEPYNPS